MCGIAGQLSFNLARPVDVRVVARMTAALRHRGPDDHGVWAQGEIGLGNRRLAVIDLSPLGHQPMTNEDGSLQIVFNGEIYGFRQLRERLERNGHRFRSDTDTETILHLYEQHGVDCLQYLRGMFAFALWDGPRRRLFMARDRLGKKPLYYAVTPAGLTFASEAKALLYDPNLRAEPDVDGLDAFLTYGYVPEELSAFRGVAKLRPAHYLTVEGGRVAVARYWTLHYEPKRRENEAELEEELRCRLDEAVRIRMVSDVPVGALLSGGIDSSAVVGLMRRHSSGPLKTFSIGFGLPKYDELAYARQVASFFETDHHELVVESNAKDLLPEIVRHYSEPFADSSALPSLALCRMARGTVTVALGGDGGDESFFGYERYRAAVVAGYQDRLSPRVKGAIAWIGQALPNRSPKSSLGRLRRFAESLPYAPRDRYGQWMACFNPDQKRQLYAPEFWAQCQNRDPTGRLYRAYERSDATTFLEATVHADVQTYLPDDLLVKMDIASMAHSLEVRSPFLDHVLVEFAASLPARLKLRGGEQKYILKRAMQGVVPKSILARAKMGFGVPIEHWLRADLREFAYELLLDSRARSRGYFEPEAVRQLLDEHMTGRLSHHFRLWALLMLEMWHRTYIDIAAPEPLDARAWMYV